MFDLNDSVIVTVDCARKGMTGLVSHVFPPGMFHSEAIICVDFGKGQSGQFTEDQLTRA